MHGKELNACPRVFAEQSLSVPVSTHVILGSSRIKRALQGCDQLPCTCDLVYIYIYIYIYIYSQLGEYIYTQPS